jgi:hypothetical protein
MTISSELSTAGPYNGNGATTIFPYGFKIADESHIRVVLLNANGTTRDLSLADGDFIVSGTGNATGGSIELTVAPGIGEKVTLLRKLPFTQETDLPNQGPYFAETVESRFDLTVMQIQAVKEITDRAFKVEPGQEVPDLSLIVASEGFAQDAQASADASSASASASAASAELSGEKALLSRLYAESFQNVPVRTTTNLSPWSQTFTNAYWGKGNVAVVANQSVAPDGTTTMDKINETASTAQHYLTRGAVGIVAGTTYTSSIWVKAAERKNFRLRISTNQGSHCDAIFDVLAGVIKTSSPLATPSIEDWGNGLYRCCVTFTAPAGASAMGTDGHFFIVTDDLSSSYLGEAGKGLYLWGAQLEVGAEAKNHVPTPGAVAATGSEYSAKHYASSMDGIYAKLSNNNVFTGTNSFGPGTGGRYSKLLANGDILVARGAANNAGYVVWGGANQYMGFDGARYEFGGAYPLAVPALNLATDGAITFAGTGAAQTRDNLGIKMLGVDQTWQDVRASRAINAVYQNTTGKPIQVSVSGEPAAGFEVSMDNIAWLRIGWPSYDGTSGSAINKLHSSGPFIVPDGSYYRFMASSLTAWMELRG